MRRGRLSAALLEARVFHAAGTPPGAEPLTRIRSAAYRPAHAAHRRATTHCAAAAADCASHCAAQRPTTTHLHLHHLHQRVLLRRSHRAHAVSGREGGAGRVWREGAGRDVCAGN